MPRSAWPRALACAAIAALGAIAACSGDGGESGGNPSGGSGGSAGAAGGAVGGGGGGAAACAPGDEEACYDGPSWTEGVGACKPGVRTCADAGSGFGPCDGQIVPAPETCASPLDDDCDGKVNESGPDCTCTPGKVVDCYSGPSGTEGVGPCRGGLQTCTDGGLGYGPCEGEIVPATETCLSPLDDDCDGAANEEGEGCVCVPGNKRLPCYDGPPGTLGVGACKEGTHVCTDDGLGFGPCEGSVVPVPETCETPEDDDCDGSANEEGAGCVCTPGTSQACYGGPPGTLGVGVCKGGQGTCNALGTGVVSCSGEVVPSPESCATPVDDDCDGAVNEDGNDCACEPGALESCYGGPPGTTGVGICKAGQALCNVQGTELGPCMGAVLPEVDDCKTPADEDCDGAPDPCDPLHVWSLRFGNASDQTGHAVAADASGNVVLAGSFAGSIDFGGGPLVSAGGLDIYVAKLDGSGKHLWSKRFGDAANQEARGVAVGPSGTVHVAGMMFGSADFGGGPLTSAGADDVFVAKLDANGKHVWSKRFGDGFDEQIARSVAVSAAGDVVLAGYFHGSIDFGAGAHESAGSADVFVAKLGPSGTTAWSKAFGSPKLDFAMSCATDAQGNVFVTGGTHGTVDFGGGPLTSAGFDDIVFAKLGPNGAHVWSKRFGDAGPEQEGRSIAVRPNGNVLLTGYYPGKADFGGGPLETDGTVDVFVAEYTPNGAHVWSKRFGEQGAQYPNSIALDAAGNVFLTGRVSGTIDFGGGKLTSAGIEDTFVAKLSPSGGHVWSRRWGDPTMQFGRSIAVDPAGAAIATGTFEGAVDFGGGKLSSAGASDVYAVKLAQ